MAPWSFGCSLPGHPTHRPWRAQSPQATAGQASLTADPVWEGKEDEPSLSGRKEGPERGAAWRKEDPGAGGVVAPEPLPERFSGDPSPTE